MAESLRSRERLEKMAASEDCTCPNCTKIPEGKTFSFGNSVIPKFDDDSDLDNDGMLDSLSDGKRSMKKNKSKVTDEDLVGEHCGKKSRIIRGSEAGKSKSVDGVDLKGWLLQSMTEDQLWDYHTQTMPSHVCGCCGLFSRIFGPFVLVLLFLQFVLGFFGRWVLVDECLVRGNLCELERYECRGPILAWYWCNESIDEDLRQHRVNFPL